MSILDQINEGQIPVTLNYLRKLKGLTVLELYERSNCHHQTALYAEPGEIRVGIEILEGLAKALDVDVDRMIRILGGEKIIARPYDRTWMHEGACHPGQSRREYLQYSKPVSGETVCNACNFIVLERLVTNKTLGLCCDCEEIMDADGLLV